MSENVEIGGATSDVRTFVYQYWARCGQSPSVAQIGEYAGLGVADVERALLSLHGSRDLVLAGDDTSKIVMAHPFSAIPQGFSVMGDETLWWGGCAWDSFAIPHLVTTVHDVLVATRCPACDNAHSWVVGRGRPPAGEQVAHFLTPVDDIWSDVVTACANQRIFCSALCVETWLLDTGNRRGYVMDLDTLWKLARNWYDGRLDRDYVRREPAMAAEYFASVGLVGEFWGRSGSSGVG
ncbi:organomercurial lyase [Pseudonocardia sp. CA-142604]|uniref:organomercurial lyase n=1 Tax=Pseudonocardia sp. CA-142604 TaxID=3240024 RepID=UPI003D8DC35D